MSSKRGPGWSWATYDVVNAVRFSSSFRARTSCERERLRPGRGCMFIEGMKRVQHRVCRTCQRSITSLVNLYINSLGDTLHVKGSEWAAGLGSWSDCCRKTDCTRPPDGHFEGKSTRCGDRRVSPSVCIRSKMHIFPDRKAVRKKKL